MLDRGALNELSAAFADALFLAYPEWESLASNLEGGVFRLEIPQPGTDRTLWADTMDGEITVGYGYYHAHFGSFLGISNGEAVDLAISEIRAFAAEQTVVVVHFPQGNWSGSMCVDASEPIASRPGATTHIYSWRGTYDRVLNS
jgi:hypothetical protein